METVAARPVFAVPLAWKARASSLLVPLAVVVILAADVSAAVALVSGVVVAVTVGNPWPAKARVVAHEMLAASVVGLGAGMNLWVVARVGLHGLAYTAVGIACALTVGTYLGRRLTVPSDASLLITVGTAICGGSAIAAVAPAIRAKDEDVSMALVTVFLLNGVALVVFPPLGHFFHMGQESFGLWCALAIHDTSSVVGAATAYGEHAMVVATAAKLARALWIVPVTFGLVLARSRSAAGPSRPAPVKKPWFILGFLAVAALVTFIPVLHDAGHIVALLARRALAVTLFLIGLGLSRPALRSLGIRPIAQAIGLWIVMAGGTLVAILAGLVE